MSKDDCVHIQSYIQVICRRANRSEGSHRVLAHWIIMVPPLFLMLKPYQADGTYLSRWARTSQSCVSRARCLWGFPSSTPLRRLRYESRFPREAVSPVPVQRRQKNQTHTSSRRDCCKEFHNAICDPTLKRMLFVFISRQIRLKRTGLLTAVIIRALLLQALTK